MKFRPLGLLVCTLACGSESAGDPEPDPVCGNGRVEAGEACDGTNFDGATCAFVLGTSDAAGALVCDQCSVDSTACIAGDCGANETFIGAGCVPNVAPEAYSFADSLSVATAFDPTDETCCFDQDGDGTLDNSIGGLLGVFQSLGTADVAAELALQVETGDLILMFEHRELPGSLPGSGPARLSMFRGTNDVDGDGQADQSLADRVAGRGVVQVRREAFGPAGAVSQCNVGQLDGDVLSMRSCDITIPIDIPGVITIDADIHEASLSATLTSTATGIVSADVQVGGWVPFTTIVRALNDAISECTCAGLSTEDRLLVIRETLFGPELLCREDEVVFDPAPCAEDEDAGFLCQTLATFCAGTSVLQEFADIDSDGNGVEDAMSLGLRLSWTGVRLADPALAP